MVRNRGRACLVAVSYRTVIYILDWFCSVLQIENGDFLSTYSIWFVRFFDAGRLFWCGIGKAPGVSWALCGDSGWNKSNRCGGWLVAGGEFAGEGGDGVGGAGGLVLGPHEGVGAEVKDLGGIDGGWAIAGTGGAVE